MRPADSYEIRNLNKIFPFIKYGDIEDSFIASRPYYDFVISIYDHTMTTEECEHCIISFSLKGAKNRKKYLQKEKLYLDFFSKLYDETAIVIKTCEDDDESVYFFRYENIDEFLTDCRTSLSEKDLFQLCLPELEVIICGTYDLENVVYYKDINKIAGIRALVAQAGLHIRE
jgi:hypothetical protein